MVIEHRPVRVEKDAAYYGEQLKVEVAWMIGERLAELNLSRARFAKRINVNPVWLTKLLRGEINLSLEELARIVYLLEGRVGVKLDGLDEE